VHNDVTFLDELVDAEFLERELASCGGARLLPSGEGPPDYAAAKARLLQELSWGGLPQIGLVAVDADGAAELVLAHKHDGRDLKLAQARETLKALAALWGRQVHLLTIENGQGRRLVATASDVKTLETRDALHMCA
jgi:stage V sporulation protein R